MEALRDYFKQKGYNVVALPKANIKPLELLALENKDLSALGSQVDVLFGEDSYPLPAIYKNQTIPDLQGQSSLSFHVNAGLGLLDGLLSALHLGKASSAAGLEDSDKIVFSFENIFEDGIMGLLDLDNYLSGSAPHTERFKTYREKLEKSELYIITSVLKCNDFSIKVINKDSQNISAKLNIPDAASADAELKRSKDNAIRISYKGKESLVFAFKAVQVIYDTPAWFKFRDKHKAGFKIKAQLGMVMREGDFPVRFLDTGENPVVIG